jgi:hypothetical protein
MSLVVEVRAHIFQLRYEYKIHSSETLEEATCRWDAAPEDNACGSALTRDVERSPSSTCECDGKGEQLQRKPFTYICPIITPSHSLSRL